MKTLFLIECVELHLIVQLNIEKKSKNRMELIDAKIFVAMLVDDQPLDLIFKSLALNLLPRPINIFCFIFFYNFLFFAPFILHLLN